jgi:hypothetical protein
MLTVVTAWLRARLALLLAAGLAGSLILLMMPGRASADLVRDDQLWVLDAVHAQQAWPVSQGHGVTVAVIDSGVNPEVSDLAGSVKSGPDLTGVGTPSSNPNWGMHGTWMASLIAGHGDEGGGNGILGVAPKARVLSVRVITDQQDPGYQRYQHESQQRVQGELARAITYAVAHHADVISMSLGYGRPSLAVRRALQGAFTHGVVVVASSGNSGASAAAHGKNAPYSFPADYPGVLGVAAVKRNGQPAGFSSDNLSVQVAAPGVKVPAQGADGKYWLVSGTSPACALTAGVAALIKGKYPHLTPELIRQAITSSASNAPSGGYDAQVGFGTVDAPAALTAAKTLAGRGASPRAGQKSEPTNKFFGGGPAAIPPAPVHARSASMLVVYILLGAACLALIIWAISRLATMRRQPALVTAGSAPDDPAASDQATGDPPPGEPAHSEPALSEPALSESAPSEPALSEPALSEPAQWTAGDSPSGNSDQARPGGWADSAAPGSWPDEDARKPWSDGGWATSGDLTSASADPEPATPDDAATDDAATASPSAWPDPPAEPDRGWTAPPAQPRPGGWSDLDATPAAGGRADERPTWRVPGQAISPHHLEPEPSGAAEPARSSLGWPRDADDQDTLTFPAISADGTASDPAALAPSSPVTAGPVTAGPVTAGPETPEPAPVPDDALDPPHRSLWAPGPAGRHAGAPHRHGVSRPAE